jgi:type VI secretion system protein ImpM
VYLTSPIWRFGLAPGVCGARGWGGVLMPSVDRVGRYFPMAVVAQLPPSCGPFTLAQGAGVWLSRAETVVLSCLEDDTLGVEALDQRVIALGAPLRAQPARPGGGEPDTPRRFALASTETVADAYADLLQALAGSCMGAYSLWWTSGSERVEPGLLVCRGLPAPRGYAAMLDGDWAAHGWEDHPLPVPGDLQADAPAR